MSTYQTRGVSTYLALVRKVELEAGAFGVQMNPMRARQLASKLYHRVQRFIHVSAAILEVPVLNKDGTPSGVVKRVVQKPGRTYRKPKE